VVAVLIIEILLNATSMFNHSNVRMPHLLDRALRWLVVTPYMHRVHHSVFPRETNSNFGFNLPWWDRLLGTYRNQPADGHTEMSIGLTDFHDERIADRLHRMLLLPFSGRSGEYSINRRGPDVPQHRERDDASACPRDQCSGRKAEKENPDESFRPCSEVSPVDRKEQKER
jgi:hypothetical protein